MKSKVVLNEGMGVAVLNRLREFTNLPDTGFVAGQAVASAVSELFGDGAAVAYNDVDVFRENTTQDCIALAARRESDSKEPRAAAALKTCTFTTLETCKDDYGELVDSSITAYQVRASKRVGMLNEVLCRFLTTDSTRFLSTFDMNCVQVGVDLETQQLCWTAKFAEFLRTRQMEIVSLHTPWHSLIRYFKKCAELDGVYGNDERMVELVAAAYRLEKQREKLRYDPETKLRLASQRWQFGALFAEKLDKVSSQVLPHFEVRSELVNNYEVFELVPRFDVDADLLKLTPASIHVLPAMSRALREMHTPARKACLHYFAKAKWEESATTRMWSVKGFDFVQGNITAAQLAEMDKALGQHKVRAHVDAPTLAGTWQKYLLLRNEVRKRGNWVYGVLENIAARDWTADSLASVLDEREQDLSKRLVAAPWADFELKGWRCTDLSTGLQLLEEGEALHHCVGGYARTVADGRSRIISIRKGGHARSWLTLQLQRASPTRRAWSVVQLRGVLNREATEEEMAVARAYALYATLLPTVGTSAARVLVKLVMRYAPKVFQYNFRRMQPLFGVRRYFMLRNLRRFDALSDNIPF